MSKKLACLGGKPVTSNLVGRARFARRDDLERKYLLEVFEGNVWDDWPPPHPQGMGARFAREWAKFNGSKFAVPLTNGTHTLQLALDALDIGYGDEVIVPGLTWQATASAVVDVSAVPVLVDIDPDTLCIDPAKVEQAITPRTRAIIPVHLYHRMADMDRIRGIARRHGLHVVEDCAHVHGSQWRGRCAGTLGVFGSFSFQSSKLMNSGEGGALLTQDEDLYWKLVSLRACGREFKEGVQAHSGNYRVTAFQAAILLGQLAAHRRNAPRIDRNGLAMDAAIAAAPGVRPLKRSAHITRMCGYAFAFNYDQDAYDGLPLARFRRALNAELGAGFGGTYEPLHMSPLYTPHKRPRNRLSASYVKAITPSRWNLPECEAAWRDRAVLALWPIYACPPSRAHLLTDAIAKVYEARHELPAAE